MKKIVLLSAFFSSLVIASGTEAYAGLDFLIVPAKYVSRNGDRAVVEVYGRRLDVSVDQIQDLKKQMTGKTVKVRLSSAEAQFDEPEAKKSR